jgi:hypothetical protein
VLYLSDGRVTQHSRESLASSKTLGIDETGDLSQQAHREQHDIDSNSLSDEDETEKIAINDESTDLQRSPGDLAVYRYYLKAAGVGRLFVFTLFVILTVFSAAFSSRSTSPLRDLIADTFQASG